MLNISDEVKNLFLQDSTKKQLVIKVDSPDSKTISDFNYYTGNEYLYGYDAVINPDGFDQIFSLENNVDLQWLYLGNYVRASMYLKLSNITSDSGTLNLRCTVDRVSGTTEYLETTINTADYLVRNKVDFYAYETKNETDPILKITLLEIHNTTQTQFAGHVERDNYQVELADTVDDLPTTFSTLYSKGKDITKYLPVPDITNEYLDFESFSMTESLCSQDNIKFGLCESAHCEFTTVGYNYDLKDRTIRPRVRVQGVPSLEDLLTVNWWKDISGRVRKGQTFHDNKTVTNRSYYWTSQFILYSDLYPYDHYFLQTPRVMIGYKLRINSLTTISGSAPVYFKIGVRCVYADGTEQNRMESVKHNYTEASDFAFFSLEILYDSQDHGKIVNVQRPFLVWHDANKDELGNGDSFTIDADFKEYMIYMYNDPTYTHYPDYDPDTCYVYDGTIGTFLTESYSDPVPLGVFHVTDIKVSHQQKLVKKQITAYDNLVKLEQNAYNWYTQYMFAVTTDDYQARYDVEYARQIYSSYFNFMVMMNLDSRDNYTETLLASYERENLRDNYMSSKRITWQIPVMSSTRDRYVTYVRIPVLNVDTTKMYMVDATNFYDHSDEQILDNETVNNYAFNIDPLKRGLVTNGGVIVEAYGTGNSFLDSFVVNRRDYFMLPDDCVSLYVYLAFSIDTYYSSSSIETYPILQNVFVYEVESAPELTNGASRLFYYNISDRSISEVDSSITGRDIVRSLLEMCGCFFRLDRYNGLPEFVYCTKGGLYPRNDLYPADDLYPRAGTDQLLPNGRYLSTTQDDYQVQDYGKVQIIVQKKSADTTPVCQMQYSDESKGINTYLIDDNIFYSNENFDREYDYAYTLLQRMFERIANMGYVPNVTQAIGMPWIECGDRIGIMTFTSGFESFIFRQNIKGIQLLIETFESVGDEYTEAVKEFGYEEYN